MHHPAEHSPLGKTTEYPSAYNPALLFPIPRTTKWAELGVQEGALPYQGVDIWTCYELSWLTPSGKPVVAMAEFEVPADSPCMIESKSFKLYLNSLNQTVFADQQQLLSTLLQDLSAVAGKAVGVQVKSLSDATLEGVGSLPGDCIDHLDLAMTHYDHPRPELLQSDASRCVSATLHSHLLRSNCPVTGQPDWGSIVVDYQGAYLEPSSLLAYLVSFRQHSDFHEQCVERVFLDVQRLLKPERLTVYARYLRRGGLDINPYRSTENTLPNRVRLVRQ